MHPEDSSTTFSQEDHTQESSTSPNEETLSRPTLIEEYIKEDPTDVDLSGLRIFSLDEITESLEKFGTNVKSLSLKKNLVHDLTPLPDSVAQSLHTLDLYDNKIRHITNLENLTNLVKLDLSYNQIEKLEGLEKLENLEELYLVENKISDLSGLKNLKKLRILELGGNKLRRVPSDSLAGLTELRELYLGKNKITNLEIDFATLPNLATVSLSANRLRAIPMHPFLNATSITQIYLAENGISSIDPKPLQNLKRLAVLDVSMNPISSLEGIEEVARDTLTQFWCTSAHISAYEEIQRLAKHSQLDTVFLEGNPIQTKETRYFYRVALLLPQVKNIDLNEVGDNLNEVRG